MRTKIILILITFLNFGGVQEISAQSFWKKLGKIADGVLEAASVGSIPNVNFEITKCEYWGTTVLIRFTVTNTSSSDLRLGFYSGAEKTYAYDENNNKYRCAFYVADQSPYSDWTTITLPSNVPVKGNLVIEGNVPRGTETIKNLRFTGKSGEKEFTYNISNQTITYAKNTNADNIFCSYPLFTFNLNKCYRVDNKVVIDATFINGRNNAVGIEGKESTIYDTEGNKYNLIGRLGGKDWDASNDLINGVPVRVVYNILDVPTSVNLFSIVKIEFQTLNARFYVEIRNLAVE